MTELDYQPMSFKDVLIEMKDISELMVDLSYSAILFDSREIALEVINLEERMNQMVYQARIQSILGARRVEEAEAMSGMLQVAEAAEDISNSASEVAKLILKDITFPARLREALPEAEEMTVRVAVGEGSRIDGRTLGDLKLQSSTGMRVIAIRRGTAWIYDPDKETHVVCGDVLMAKGPQTGEKPLYEIAGAEYMPETGAGEPEPMSGLDRAVSVLVEMKNISELSVGLAYTALLFDNKEVAHEVVSLDTRMDDMRYQMDLWILEEAKRIKNVESLRGLLYMSSFAETISSAARAIVDVILREIEVLPVFRKIIRESDEIISRVAVTASSPLVGMSLKEVSLGTVTGMVVLAIRSGNRWIYRPGKDVRLKEGDTIIAKGRRDGECRLFDLALGRKTNQNAADMER